MDETAFRRYIALFNAAHYDELVRYYADDVTLSFADGRTLRGRDGIVAFYRPIHAAVREVLEIEFLLIAGDRIATELYTEFHCVRDFPSFPGRRLSAGEILRLTSFVHYELQDDRFRRIRVARYRTHDADYRASR